MRVVNIPVGYSREKTIDDVYEWLKERDTDTTEWVVIGYDEVNGTIVSDTNGLTCQGVLWVLEQERLRVLGK